MTQKNDDVFNQEEERYLKSYYQKLDQQWGVDPSTSEAQLAQFSERLNQERTKNASWRFSWKFFMAALLAAFSMGLLSSRWIMVPELVATRGIESTSHSEVSANSPPKIVSITTLEPKAYTEHLIDLTKDAGLEVTVITSGQNRQISVKPFLKGDTRQAAAREFLGVEADTVGVVTVIMTQPSQ